jgi:hypothetical protein
MPAQVVDHVAACPSCGQPLIGPYCAQCGEKLVDPEAQTVRHFVTHSIVDELIHLDGRFWRTVRSLLGRPGFLAAEFSAGRRRPYVKPVKLLIAAFLTYAVLTRGGLIATLTVAYVNLSVAPTAVPSEVSIAETVRRTDRFSVLGRQLERKARVADTTSDRARERFHNRYNAIAQSLSFANVLLLALLLFALFRRRRPLFVEHGVFSMHFVSFVLLSSIAFLPGLWLSESGNPLAAFFFLFVSAWQFAYLAIAIRRFYFDPARGSGRSRLASVAVALCIYILNSAFITVVQMVGVALALRSL